MLDAEDAVWAILLQAAATLGGSRGWDGLIGTKANHSRVTWDAVTSVARDQRVAHFERVLRDAKVRFPAQKAAQLAANFERIEGMGGVVAARATLLEAPGRDGKMAFLKQFKGIGDKYARNALMDCYHPDFRDSIALDSRVRSITTALGLRFPNYEAEERFYLDVALRAGLNGWEVDRLIYNHRDAVIAGLS
jgi:hypothetical protein